VSERVPMAMTIFLLLSSLGVVFLLYVLTNFWREGRRSRNYARKYAAEFGQQDCTCAVVVTQRMSQNAQGAKSVIPFQPRTQKLQGKPASGKAIEMPLRRISTR